MAIPYERDALTDRIIGLAIEVHRHLGPGLLESTYEECLCYELTEHGIGFKRQMPLPVVYKSVRLDCGYRYRGRRPLNPGIEVSGASAAHS